MRAFACHIRAFTGPVSVKHVAVKNFLEFLTPFPSNCTSAGHDRFESGTWKFSFFGEHCQADRGIYVGHQVLDARIGLNGFQMLREFSLLGAKSVQGNFAEEISQHAALKINGLLQEVWFRPPEPKVPRA